MPYRRVDPLTGAVIFRSTPEEKAMENLREENTSLKLTLSKVIDALNKAGINIDDK